MMADHRGVGESDDNRPELPYQYRQPETGYLVVERMAHPSGREKSVLFRCRRESHSFHFADVSPDRVSYSLAYLAEMTHEFGLEAFVHTEHVLNNENLAVGFRAGTYADGRDAEFPGEIGSKRSRNFFENQSKTSQLLKHQGVGNQPVGLGIALGAHSVASELVDRLGRQSKMGTNRNAGGKNSGY